MLSQLLNGFQLPVAVFRNAHGAYLVPDVPNGDMHMVNIRILDQKLIVLCRVSSSCCNIIWSVHKVEILAINQVETDGH